MGLVTTKKILAQQRSMLSERERQKSRSALKPVFVNQAAPRSATSRSSLRFIVFCHAALHVTGVVLSCSNLARRWVALERRSAWLVVHAQIKACSRKKPTVLAGHLKHTYGHNSFQIIHIHTTVISSGRAHTTQHRTHCGAALWSADCSYNPG